MEVENEESSCNECNNDLSLNSSYLTRNGTLVCEECAAPFLANQYPDKSLTIPPVSVLETLKCSQCLEYLSCGPVHLSKNQSATCGRCIPPDNSAHRNIQYEALAQLILFPCRYKKFGCSELVKFVYYEDVEHEKICQFGKEDCPVRPSECDWKGSHLDFLKHCEEYHAHKIAKNSCRIAIRNIIQPTVRTLLLIAFNHQFTVHIKICAKTHNIYQMVQHVGEHDKDISEKYDFTVNILRKNRMVKRQGQITPRRKVQFNRNTSLTTSITNLGRALAGFDKWVFTTTVNKIEFPDGNCVKCGEKIEQFLYKEDGNWYCKDCIPEKTIYCPNQGCGYNHLEKKCKKHELFFCSHGTWCWLCRQDIPQGEFSSHYTSKHSERPYKESCQWKAQFTGAYDILFLLQTSAGETVIKYRYTESVFRVQIHTQLPTQQLYKYYCVLKLMDPARKQDANIYVLNSVYNEIHDWKLEINENEFKPWPENISVIVNIEKGAKPDFTGMRNVVYQE